MKFIGLDFSITAPAFCITEDFKTWKFIAAVNKNETKKFKGLIDNWNDEYSGVNVIFVDHEIRKKSEHYHLTERNKLSNYMDLVDSLLDRLEKEVKGQDCIVAIEGISFSSKGNALVDIALATGMIRYQLAERFLKKNLDKFFVFSPSSLKNAIGAKGNAKKDVIMETFLSDPGIESVRKSDLYKLLLNEREEIIINERNIKSPYMDMVDAFLAVLKLYNELKNND